MKAKAKIFAGVMSVLLAFTMVVTGCKRDPEPEVPEVNTYTVTFDSNGGSTVKAVSVNEGEKVEKPADPTKDGYDFDGWYNGEEAYDFDAVVTANLKLTASWKVINYSITYDVGEGTNSEENPASYTIESEDITLKDAAGPAATPNFVAWHIGTAEGDAVEGVAIKKGSTGAKTFVAEFTEKKVYKVKYYDGEDCVYTENVVEGNDPAGAAIEKTGYTFGGWYADPELTTEATFTGLTSDLNVYGKYTAIIYTVKFVSSDGTEVPSQSIAYGSKATAPTATFGTRTGFTADGNWYVNGKKFDFTTDVIKADTTMYYGWVYDTPVTVTTSATIPVVLPSDGSGSAVECNLPNEYLPKAGDIIVVKLSAISTTAIADLSVEMVCNAQDTVTETQTEWGFVRVANATVMAAAVEAKTDFDAEVDLVVTADCNGTGARTHTLKLSQKAAAEASKLYKKGTDVENIYVSKSYVYTISGKTLGFAKNGSNYECSLTNIIPANVTLNATDTVTINIEGCFDIAIPYMNVVIVDNAEDTSIGSKTSYAYQALTGYENIQGGLAEKTDFEATKELTITANQIGTGVKAHQIRFQIGGATDEGSVPTLYPKGHNFGATYEVVSTDELAKFDQFNSTVLSKLESAPADALIVLELIGEGMTAGDGVGAGFVWNTWANGDCGDVSTLKISATSATTACAYWKASEFQAAFNSTDKKAFGVNLYNGATKITKITVAKVSEKLYEDANISSCSPLSGDKIARLSAYSDEAVVYVTVAGTGMTAGNGIGALHVWHDWGDSNANPVIPANDEDFTTLAPHATSETAGYAAWRVGEIKAKYNSSSDVGLGINLWGNASKVTDIVIYECAEKASE